MFKAIYIKIKMYIVFFISLYFIYMKYIVLILLFIKTLNYLVNNSYNSGRMVIILKMMEKHYNYQKYMIIL